MNYVEQLVDGVNAYFDLNLATLSGAIDIIVVEQPDGSLKSTPFHVRFGKIMLLRASQKVVTIRVNDQKSNINMKLGHAGEAFFVEDVPPPSPTHPPNSPLSDYLLTSPIIAPLSSPSSPQVSSPTFFSPSRSRSCSPPPADFLPSGIPMTSSSPIPHSPSFTSPSSPSPVPFSSPSFSPSDSPRRTKPTLSSSHSSSSLPIGKRGHSKSQLIQKERVGEKENDPVGEEGLALTSFLTSRIAEFDDDVLPPAAAPLSPSPLREQKEETKDEPRLSGSLRGEGSEPMQIHQEEIEEIEESFFSPPLPMTRLNHNTESYSVFKPVFHSYDKSKDDEENFCLDDIEYLQLNDEEIPFFDPPSPLPPSSSSVVDSSTSPSDPPPFVPSSSSSQVDQKPENWEWSWGWGSLPVMKRQNKEGVEEKCAPPLPPVPTTPAFPRKLEKIDRHQDQQQQQSSGEELVGWWEGNKEEWWGNSYWENSVEIAWEKGKEKEKEKEKEALEMEDVEEPSPSREIIPVGPHVELSACLEELKDKKKIDDWDKIFDAGVMGYEDFAEGLTRGSQFFTQSNIAFRVNGQIYLSWGDAVIALLSWSAFHRPPPPRLPTPIEGLSDVVEERDPLLLLLDPSSSSSSSSSSSGSGGGRRGWLSWFWWQKRQPQQRRQQQLQHQEQLQLPPPQLQEGEDQLTQSQEDQLDLLPTSQPNGSPTTISTTTTVTTTTVSTTTTTIITNPSHEQKMKKTLRPTSEMLKKLNLKKGCNTISFSVETEFRGKQEIHAHIWLWSHTERIVVSDIDGTITRSDVFGQILPLLGKDWSHSGVTELYTAIAKHGYKIMYLSSRAIGQSYLTKTFISSVKQGEHKLPPGPVMLSPDRLLTSFNREVILRMPQVFKIAVLKDIVSLFPSDKKPFYAGFGNRMSDVIAYQEAGTPLGKVFMINPTGEIRIPVKSLTYKKSYAMMSDLIQHMFPPVVGHKPHEEEAFSETNYWSVPPSNVDVEW